MVDLAPGATVRVVNPGATVRVSAPGLVKGLWLKEGPMGPVGPEGPQGLQGIQGAKGDTGATGPTGPAGAGDVVGPASSTDLRIAIFSGTSGKLLATGGNTIGGVLSRVNHTGTQSADTVTDGTTNKAYTATEKTKLAGIATAATANATDAQLRDRSTHTGTQAASTITGLGTAATVNTGTGAGQIPILNATPGTASASTYLTGAGTWATPPAGGGGGLLAYVERTSTTASASYSTTSSTVADVDATNLAVTFTAPASGVVMVRLAASAAVAAATYSLIWSLRSGTTLVAGSERAITAVATATRANAAIRVTGLTPGNAYTYKWAWRLSAAGTGTLYYGGPSPEGSGLNYGPATMEVWSA